MIDSYDFGVIIVDGQEYHSDILVLPSGVRDWWRREGHKLTIADLSEVVSEKPEILILGTGAYQGVQVSPGIQPQLQSQGIELMVQDTDRACHTYNKLHLSRRVAAALHLTC